MNGNHDPKPSTTPPDDVCPDRVPTDRRLVTVRAGGNPAGRRVICRRTSVTSLLSECFQAAIWVHISGAFFQLAREANTLSPAVLRRIWPTSPRCYDGILELPTCDRCWLSKRKTGWVMRIISSSECLAFAVDVFVFGLPDCRLWCLCCITGAHRGVVWDSGSSHLAVCPLDGIKERTTTNCCWTEVANGVRFVQTRRTTQLVCLVKQQHSLMLRLRATRKGPYFKCHKLLLVWRLYYSVGEQIRILISSGGLTPFRTSSFRWCLILLLSTWWKPVIVRLLRFEQWFLLSVMYIIATRKKIASDRCLSNIVVVF